MLTQQNKQKVKFASYVFSIRCLKPSIVAPLSRCDYRAIYIVDTLIFDYLIGNFFTRLCSCVFVVYKKSWIKYITDKKIAKNCGLLIKNTKITIPKLNFAINRSNSDRMREMEHMQSIWFVLFLVIFNKKFTLANPSTHSNFTMEVSNDSPIFCGDLVHIKVALINNKTHDEYIYQLLGKDEVIQKKRSIHSYTTFTFNTPGSYCETIMLNVIASYRSSHLPNKWIIIAQNQTKIFINGKKFVLCFPYSKLL